MGFLDRWRKRNARVEAPVEAGAGNAPSKRLSRRSIPKVQMRSVGSASGTFEAGESSRLTASWTNTPMSAVQVVERNFLPLVARSREKALNSDHARKFLALVKTNVAGPRGILVHPAVKNIKGELDTLANQALAQEFKKWCKRGICDITGMLTWVQVQHLAIQTAARDGEVFIRTLRGRDFGPYAFQLQLIDPIRVDVTLRQDLTNGNRIRCGIEFSPFGKPLAYYVRKDFDDYTEGYTLNGSRYDRVPADEIIHLFVPEMIGQPRGFGWMATALTRMHHLTAFETAAVINARVGASKMGFFSQDPEFVDEDDDDDDIIDDLPMDADPGTFDELPPGYEFHKFDPQYPSGEFDPFTKSCLRSISSGLLVSYASLSGDLSGANYGSIRQGSLDERDVWELLQSWFRDWFVCPVYEAWVSQAVLMGAVKIGPTPLRPERVAQYREARYRPRGWKWIDPSKDVKAARSQNDSLHRSISDVIREQGGEPDEVFEEIKEEREKLSALGISIPGQAKPEPEKPEEDEDAESKSAAS